MTSAHAPLTVGSLFGPYRLDRLIGRGGMGEVYQAHDTVKGRTVAIKVLPERMAQDPVYRARFQRESHVAARLREAHVIPIHDYGEIDGRLFIDMRLVDGDSLRSLLHRAGPGAPERTVGIIEQVAAALDAAHADGLLHRDIKPDNILLTREGFTYLVDFGIAQSATDPSLTSDGSAVGSFRYMAPERFSARTLDPTSDIYSLACVLFECLTGSRPFTGQTDAQIMRAHLFDPVPRPSLVRTNVPPALDAVVARGMAKNPNERYQTAGELAAAARAAVTAPSRTGPIPANTAPTARLGGSPPVTAPPPQRMPSGHTDPNSARPGDISSEGTGTGPPPDTTPSGPVTPPRRGRRGRRVLAVLATLVLVLAAAAFAGWATLSGNRTGNPVPDSTALDAADVELLSLVSTSAYHRAGCYHEEHDSVTTALFVCEANPAASAPTARFWRFRTADAMQNYYKTVVLGGLHGASCPSDPAGVDGPSLVDGKEVGRKTCFDNKTETPDTPKPTLVLTNNAATAMAIYIWDDPNEAPLRDYRAKTNGGQFVSAENAHDPDVFTPADREVLKKAGAAFTANNCVHLDPPGAVAVAVINCGNVLGAPGVGFFGFADRKSANALYQGNLAQFPGHACGGTGNDEVWRKSTGVAGRFFCYNEPSGAVAGQVCLFALHDELMLTALMCTLAPDSPENGPKTEAALLTWFQENFS